MIENGRGLRTTIDVVAEHHDQASAFERLGIRNDQFLEGDQFLEAAMHVTDGVDGCIFVGIEHETWRPSPCETADPPSPVIATPC